jgi:cation diffusion facilitator CzcD-associated flavoprotein CzcO
MGMSSVPLSELYAGAERFLSRHGSQVLYNTFVEGADWNQETAQWTVHGRGKVSPGH